MVQRPQHALMELAAHGADQVYFSLGREALDQQDPQCNGPSVTTDAAIVTLESMRMQDPRTHIFFGFSSYFRSVSRNRSKGQQMKSIEPTMPRVAQVKKAAPKAETVTLKHLAMALAGSHSVPKSQVNAMLTAMVEDIAKHLKKGKRIRINGLGILQVRKRPARMGRNPATGEAIKIKASKKSMDQRPLHNVNTPPPQRRWLRITA